MAGNWILAGPLPDEQRIYACSIYPELEIVRYYETGRNCCVFTRLAVAAYNERICTIECRASCCCCSTNKVDLFLIYAAALIYDSGIEMLLVITIAISVCFFENINKINNILYALRGNF